VKFAEEKVLVFFILRENAKMRETLSITLMLKSHFAWRKSATKFLCVKTVSYKVVRHSLSYLTVQKWLLCGDPFYLKMWIKVTTLERNRRFSISFRS